MYARWGDQVQFVDIMVRQAHPGPDIPPYVSLPQKLREAEIYQREQGIAWPVLADDLPGTVHQVYGGLSDPIYLIDRDGRIAFYNMMTSAPTMHTAIERLLAQGARGVVGGGYDQLPHLIPSVVGGWPALVRGLPQSVTDLMWALPGSPIPVWVGYQLKPLIGWLALRGKPLPTPLRRGLTLLAIVLVGLFIRWWRQRQIPVITHSEEQRFAPSEAPAVQTIPEEARFGERPMQLSNEGTGPLFHRRYQVDIATPQLTKEATIDQVKANPTDFCPTHLAVFEKTLGEEGGMALGDEYVVKITAPWNAPVRVIDVQPTSFTFITLEGHPEAGEIQFRLIDHPTLEGHWRFEILSWARSKDKMVDLVYDKLTIMRKMQQDVWSHFCQKVVEVSGGERVGEIEVFTEEIPEAAAKEFIRD